MSVQIERQTIVRLRSTTEASDQSRVPDADAEHDANHVAQHEQREHLLVENASSNHPLSQIQLVGLFVIEEAERGRVFFVRSGL